MRPLPIIDKVVVGTETESAAMRIHTYMRAHRADFSITRLPVGAARLRTPCSETHGLPFVL